MEYTNKDLDFYLTVIAMFCKRHNGQHHSDIMFGDLSSKLIETKEIILKLAEDGYVTARQSKNLPHRVTFDITNKGVLFQQSGGYSGMKKSIAKQNLYKRFEKLIWILVGSILTEMIRFLTN